MLIRLPYLTTDDVAVAAGGPGLTQLAANTLGNDMTAADGFDAALLQLAADAGTFANLGSSFDSLLGVMDFLDGDLAAKLINPLVADFQTFVAGGDNLRDASLSTIGVAGTTAPAPTPPPPPVTTTGGDNNNTPVYDGGFNTGPGFTTIIYTDEPTPMPGGGGGGGGTGWPQVPDTG